ncbi:hypothetical protein M378DRAFT_365376 [Amanita muscaria Koide BX008]|uniref:Uncharacterized protein n=1 Tax=Amanita muscaria (strain Koide BX008) TaxID=946122 RepID=A0A0C2WLV6_AMAMK|nr:hypothetical protein M378DRAFT_365376 [Amanita muscaria Koide BX008]
MAPALWYCMANTQTVTVHSDRGPCSLSVHFLSYHSSTHRHPVLYSVLSLPQSPNSMQKWFLVDPRGQHIQSARKRGQAHLTVATRLLKVVPGSYRDHRVVIYVFDVVILVATNMMKK